MTSAPPVMGDEAPPISLDGTPRPILARNNYSPTRSVSEAPSTINLRLAKVIGTTTTSACGFDFNVSKSCFVTCAGSVVVWNYVDARLDVTQRFFRAHPSVSPQTNPIEPGTPTKTDRRKSQLSPVRASALGVRNTPASPSQPPPGILDMGGARQGNRAAACVSLSQDGRTLAVGEIGYNPQIYLFACAADSPLPVATLSDHSYGVRCVALSSDARWLASVGDIHDGYIFVWALGTRVIVPKLLGSNKCVSIINGMIWMGKAIVTVGIRHVKVWRPELTVASSPTKTKFRASMAEGGLSSPSSKALNGRNCIMGSLLESNFTCVAAISETRAVIGTDKGDLCLLDDTGGNQKLAPVRNFPFAIFCVSVDNERREVGIASGSGEVLRLPFDALEALPGLSQIPNESNGAASAVNPNLSNVVGLGLLRDCIVTLDSARRTQIRQRDNMIENFSALPYKDYPSHQSAVLGPSLIPASGSSKGCFMTYDSAGSLMLWDRAGGFQSRRTIPLDQLPLDDGVELNELKIARLCTSGRFLVCGDKYGMLRSISWDPWNPVSATRAHQGELNDVAICQIDDGTELVASCGRDRIIQVFELLNGELKLVQTIDQHSSSVSCIVFQEGGKLLLSASVDRTIGIYALATAEGSRAYLALRLLTLKQTPISLALDRNQPNILYTTTLDKQLYAYDMSSGQCLSSNRTADEKQTNPVLLSSLSIRAADSNTLAKRILVGVSSTDKSVRVHDLESGSTLARDYGHSEGVSGVAVISEAKIDNDQTCRIVSSGLDATAMLWELSYAPRAYDQSGNSSPVLESPAVAHPLRRVLSKSAFADFSKSLEADGISPIPPSTPSRGSSPTRARNRFSMAATPSASPRLHTPRLRRLDRSPSPGAPHTPTQTPRRPPPARTRSVENFQSIDLAAEQLCTSLRDFRRKMASSSERASPSVARELEKQLSTTLSSISTSNPGLDSVGDGNVGDLLDHYADRLAQLVEHKVSLGVTGRIRNASSQEVGSSVESSEPQSEADESEVSPTKLDSVPESGDDIL